MLSGKGPKANCKWPMGQQLMITALWFWTLFFFCDRRVRLCVLKVADLIWSFLTGRRPQERPKACWKVSSILWSGITSGSAWDLEVWVSTPGLVSSTAPPPDEQKKITNHKQLRSQCSKNHIFESLRQQTSDLMKSSEGK